MTNDMITDAPASSSRWAKVFGGACMVIAAGTIAACLISGIALFGAISNDLGRDSVGSILFAVPLLLMLFLGIIPAGYLFILGLKAWRPGGPKWAYWGAFFLGLYLCILFAPSMVFFWAL